MADGQSIKKSAQIRWQDWVRLNDWPRSKGPSVLRVVDAFSGCGGMSLGAWEGARRVNSKVEIALAIDSNKAALGVLSNNFSAASAAAICGDIREFIPGCPGDPVPSSLRALVNRVGEVDLFLAGPPCQGHSDLNNRSRRVDPRNELYISAIRSVSVFKPKVAIIENVPAVIHDRARHVHNAAKILGNLGYEVFQTVVTMTDFGVPQSRKRHVTIASRIHSRQSLIMSVAPLSSPAIAISEYLNDIVDEENLGRGIFFSVARTSEQNRKRMTWLFENDEYDLPDRLRPPCHRDRAHTYRSMYGRLNWNRPAQTITSGFGSMGQGRFVHPLRPRTLTCHEAARIQGFPDFFSFESVKSLTALRDMIGNAVPPQFCAAVVQRLFPRESGSP